MFNSKDLLIENTKLSVKLEMLEQEAVRLRQRVSELEKALLSKVAPEAYRDQLYREAQVNPQVESEEDKNLKLENEILRNYAVQIERPIFDGAEDMITKLSGIIGIQPPESFHNNEES